MVPGVEWERNRGRLARRGLLGLVAAVLVGVLLVAPSGHAPSTMAAAAGCDTSTVLRDTSSVDRIESDAQQDFLQRLNGLRRSKGLGSLVWNQAMTGPAISWSRDDVGADPARRVVLGSGLAAPRP